MAEDRTMCCSRAIGEQRTRAPDPPTPSLLGVTLNLAVGMRRGGAVLGVGRGGGSPQTDTRGRKAFRFRRERLLECRLQGWLKTPPPQRHHPGIILNNGQDGCLMRTYRALLVELYVTQQCKLVNITITGISKTVIK